MSREREMTTRVRPARRMKRKTLYIVATVAFLVLYGLFVMLSGEQPWLIWPGLGAMLVSTVFACLWMTTLDEAARQAHYISWFWGGSAGLMVSLLLLVAAVLRPEAFETMLAPLDVTHSFTAGIVCAVAPATFGYLIWWIVLWLRRG